ncbi:MULTISPECIES: hypothetical protein [Acinetobacter]|uniref:Uncharacterized protein n=2 Tax=Acinetobacter higginsii TaxID=70347 RepID=N9T9X0_9GAMM|nr:MULTISPECIES: hypothetical protein [Acinetobacter]ENX60427.1 hypothetical protein F902_00971 [Acinetobacter higginsii]MCH7303868.1 hypothetical protein [Acinetobacter higginsii]MDO3664195.1 hypothetical protein [Acinetobacter higginsii]NNP77141.1 hypothetical protein [Acinetobacter sp. Ac_3412]
MKKITLWLFVISLILISLIIFTTLIKSSHTSPYFITISGNQLQEQVDLVPDQLWFDMIAKGNDPISSISFELKNKNITGWIDLNLDSNVAIFQRLDAQQDHVPWSVYTTSTSEKAIGSYQIDLQTSQQNLNLQFHNTPIRYQLEHSEQQSVQLSGQLQFKVPSHWPVLKSKRFPQLPIQGQFIFDEQPYQLIRMNSAVSQHSVLHDPISYQFSLKHQDQWVDFTFQQDNISSQPLVQITTHDQLYQLKSPAPQNLWHEDDKKIVIRAKNILLQAKSGQTKSLNINLVIPKNYAHLSINHQDAKLIPANSELLAEARNEQKIYQLSFVQQHQLLTLELIEEMQGNFSLKFITEDGEQYFCGNTSTACPGLTIEPSKQTFLFNQVKLGSHLLNGSLFIAGVL